MRLLILTQKIDINDDVLGFMHGWVKEFSHQFAGVIVICLEKGAAELPSNVKVLSLGKETGRSKIKYLINFYKHIWRERKNYDAVFVHMNHEYVILGGLIWKALGKKIGLWYAHGYVPPTLKISAKLADYIFSSTKSGFRLESQKLNVVGQGIDLEKFSVDGGKNKKLEQRDQLAETSAPKSESNQLAILTIGRIAPSKDYLTLIKAAGILNESKIKFNIQVVGGTSFSRHENYFNEIKRKVKELGLPNMINFIGAIPYKDIFYYLNKSDLFVNMSHTGSLDKAILEAMASKLPIITCNEAVIEVLGNYKGKLMFKKGDYRALAERILFIRNLPQGELDKIGQDLRQLVIKNHSLGGLITKILAIYGKEN